MTLLYSRIKGLASGTEMTGRELHHFFHFDMPPYLVILLSINIVVTANECMTGCFCCFGGNNKSVKEISLRKTCVMLGMI